MGRLTRAVSAVDACLAYTWPVLTTVAAVVGSERLTRWVRPEDEVTREPEVVG